MPRFFIVEDDDAVADALALFLTENGHTAIRYGDAESFFRGVVPAAGDTIIIDLGLPGMSGRQLICWVSQLRDEPKIIVISGKADRALRSELEGLKIERLIRKPLDASDVQSLL